MNQERSEGKGVVRGGRRKGGGRK